MRICLGGEGVSISQGDESMDEGTYLKCGEKGGGRGGGGKIISEWGEQHLVFIEGF
jgi:hypothetical protein